MTSIAALAVVLAVLGLLFVWRPGSGVPGPFRMRPCQGTHWHQRFPHASKASIRQFLNLFASAFAIRESEALHFGPDDELLAIYRARYPSRETPDALEIETLDRALKKKHGVALAGIWHEHLTLGELYSRACVAQQAVQGDGPASGGPAP